MLRQLKIILVAWALGAVCGAAAWYLASPLFFDQVVSENLETGEGTMTVKTGSLRDADAVHRGTGDVRIVATASGVEVQLANFEVTNGPDLEVWLSTHPDPMSSSDVSGNDWISLGQLKGNIGDQSYAIPMGTDLSAYKSLVIWCEQFGVLFSPAALN